MTAPTDRAPSLDFFARRFLATTAELNVARARLAGLAEKLREIAETYLYDGDTDQPINDGYRALYDAADQIGCDKAGNSSPANVTSGPTP